MTDKQIIETLRNLQKHCASFGEDRANYVYLHCEHCTEFHLQNKPSEYQCRLKKFFNELAARPFYWDIEKIERIINE